VELIAERLSGSRDPLPHPYAELRKEYFASPLEVYASADATTRGTLHRLLYCDVLLRTLTHDLAADGSNGFVIAERIDKQIPEQHALAETFRDRALAVRAREVESLSKAEMLALAREYRDRRQIPQADQLVEAWLTLRRRRLDPQDTEGLLQLTDDYRQLVRRNDLADLLLKEAWKRNPRLTDIAERLKQAGYRLHEGVWLSEAEFNARPEGQLEQAIRAGRVDIGMSASHVRRSLGEPQSLARAATAGQITEVWTYEQAAATRLVVRLTRGRRQSDLKVAEVSQLSDE
jgi:hypothetical protein